MRFHSVLFTENSNVILADVLKRVKEVPKGFQKSLPSSLIAISSTSDSHFLIHVRVDDVRWFSFPAFVVL